MEMSVATAVRLGRRARGKGPWARRARQRLVRAGDRGETLAIYELWDLWLAAPDAELWTALSRWRVPKVADKLTHVALGLDAATADVVAAARRVGHPVAEIARARILAGDQKLVDGVCEAATADEVIAAFCLEHQLAPSDAHRAAVFFLLTGQREQYHDVDPDHSLLTVAYQAAGEAERSRIRARVIGEPDLVRVLATAVGRGRLTRLGSGEADYLIARFAERRDWPGLWELVKELPVLDAATAVRRFDDWRPDGPDITLFDALAAADPDELARSHAAAARPRHLRLPVTATSEGSISPDGRRVVVGGSVSVEVFTITADGEPQLEAQQSTQHRCEVLALDDAVVINHSDRIQPPAGFTENGYVPDDSESGIYRVTKGVAFDRIADGFAALAAADSKEGRLLHLVSGSGPELAGYDHRVLDLAAELGLSTRVAGDLRNIATDPESGLIALAGKDLYLARITPQGLERLATAPFDSGLHPRLQFSGPDRLTTMDEDRVLRVWRVEGDELHVVAERRIAGANPVDLPGGGVIAMMNMSGVRAGTRQVRYVDRETLVDVPTHDRFNRPQDSFGVFASPDGTWLGVNYWDGVDITEVGFAELAHRPLAATTPADLHTVRARLADTPTSSTARPFLELLRTSLEHRFGTDVALGGGRPSPWRSDDVSLGGTA